MLACTRKAVSCQSVSIKFVPSKALGVSAKVNYPAGRALFLFRIVIRVNELTLVMQAGMFFTRKQLQILNSIVTHVFIFMVNDFVKRKLSSQVLFHHKSVFVNTITLTVYLLRYFYVTFSIPFRHVNLLPRIA